MKMKNTIKNILKIFSLELRRLDDDKRFKVFEKVYKTKVRSEPIIFDIGANEGQSIERFKSLFPDSIIHSFEPDINLYSILKKYGNDDSIVLNNFGVGNKSELKKFNVNAKSETSSFLKLRAGSDWLKERSVQYNTTVDGFTNDVIDVEVVTIDQYAKKHNIEFIDILKSDTQGYDDKVIKGCKKLIEDNLISFLELEIIFDDVYENILALVIMKKYCFHGYRNAAS